MMRIYIGVCWDHAFCVKHCPKCLKQLTKCFSHMLVRPKQCAELSLGGLSQVLAEEIEPQLCHPPENHPLSILIWVKTLLE